MSRAIQANIRDAVFFGASGAIAMRFNSIHSVCGSIRANGFVQIAAA